MNRRAAAIAQFQMPGHKVRMKVGEKDVADLEAELLRIGEVLMDIALRIDDDRGPALLIAEEIGSMRETAEIVLFQDHWVSASLALTVAVVSTKLRLFRVASGKAKAT